MTAKKDILFVTDAECADRIGLTTEQFRGVLPVANKEGFPMKDPLFANRYYWPAVRAWLDRRYGIDGTDGPYVPDGLDGEENWK
ncbi:hypothetical protein [Rhizobium sp. Leaf453]|uniref:hypothetical protein n=1 Tax=Rhizobium sp. Leaf453 TaxID=1736380 RepID=UPI0007138927|nr:hypothetical protein [Rhizobium sp. Leaf453]KQT97530.1 hypothetical protein ASG68_08345 [Rhizobium sp. Leaf453]